MAKANSPVRLQAELMAAARTTGARWHRSAAQQVEYWAELGRRVSDVLNPDALLAVQAGSVQLLVKPVDTPAVDSDAVFARLDAQRASGELARAVTGARLRYQASVTHPGQLEQLHPDGRVVVGRFVDGEFRPGPA